MFYHTFLCIYSTQIQCMNNYIIIYYLFFFFQQKLNLVKFVLKSLTILYLKSLEFMLKRVQLIKNEFKTEYLVLICLLNVRFQSSIDTKFDPYSVRIIVYIYILNSFYCKTINLFFSNHWAQICGSVYMSFWKQLLVITCLISIISILKPFYMLQKCINLSLFE